MSQTLRAEAPISLSPLARRKVRELLAQQPEGSYLRIGVAGGGCSGLSYRMEFVADELGPRDQTFEVEGIPIVSDIKSLLYLSGMVIDFSTDLVGGGFRFNNPNATNTCGCGTSFSV